MKKERVLLIFFLLTATLSMFPAISSAQLVLGQYEGEAPFLTWNTFPFAGAAALGRGETCFALASDASSALSNPALLPGLPKFSLTIGGYYQVAEFYKYGPVNTGVMGTENNIGQGLFGLDSAGVSYSLGGWAFALNVSVTELYNRPEAKYEETYGDGSAYLLDFTQEGILRNINFSIGRRIFPWLSAGLGLNYVTGSLHRKLLEQETPVGYTISDQIGQDFTGFFINGGFLVEISDKFKAAAVFRTPYAKKAANSGVLRYSYATSSGAPPDIVISASSNDVAEQPPILGFGLSYAVLPELVLTADSTYFAWSKYKLDEFGEKQERDFKDIVKLGAGAEYTAQAGVFGAQASIPFRIGLVYDPQPMKNPGSSYIAFTFGNGVHWKNLRLDLGAMLGRESGSGNNLAVKRFALSLGFNL
jgi:long-subunit fatty acid transport protein